MNLAAIETVVIALFLGVFSSTLARWLRIPSILFYLASGIIMGPVGLGVLHGDHLGRGLMTLVEMGVAIILFEGGLSLSSKSFRSESSAIRRILVLTIPLTGLGASLLSKFLLPIGWGLSLFFGAIIVVTGPTVVGSLLRSLYLHRRLETLLHWESIWGDVLGVILSAVALELIVTAHGESFAGIGLAFFLKILEGVALGLLSGFLLSRLVLPWVARFMDPGLPGIVALAWALATFVGANALMDASGPLAVAIAGFFLSHLKSQMLHEIRHFKEQLSSIFIGIIFVLLSASINLLELVPLWPKLFLVAILLGAIVRPFSVMLALLRTSLSWRERLFIGLIGPRGIVAIATVFYASFLIRGHRAEMDIVLNLTFIVIFLSGAIATIISGPLSRILRVMVCDSERGILIVGMNPLSLGIADYAAKYVPVAFADTSQDSCSYAEALGHETVCADVLDSDLYEDALEEGFGRLLVITKNDALNQLIAHAASMHLGPDKTFRAQAPPTEDAISVETTSTASIAFSRDLSVPHAVDMLENKRATLEVLHGHEIGYSNAIPLIEVAGEDRGVHIVTEGHIVKGDALCLVPEAEHFP
ncbi:MAG: sodium:proton antiporter, partial [Deltaproteobacteria bacterium]|nr:sodium:proton antiporter [Deltaproteobacteria bacterium]